MGCTITGWGKRLPKRVVTNDELSRVVDTNDEWIVERTGIHERHIAIEESSTDLAAEAASMALKNANLAPSDIDLLICMTITPDSVVPAQACLVKARLGLDDAIAFDLNAACSGCIYGIQVASTMIEASVAADQLASQNAPSPVHAGNTLRRALVVGVERMSRIVDWEDRATCVLFGDGSGAVVLEWNDSKPGILGSVLKNTDDATLSLVVDQCFDMSTFPFADGLAVESVSEIMGIPLSAEAEVLAPNHPFVVMNGQQVFKFATHAMVDAAKVACERAGVPLSDVDCIVPHQANDRIIRYAAKKLDIPYERFQVSIGSVGNTSASSVLMALSDAFESDRIASGDKVLLVGFGGGLTSGALVFEA